MSQSMMSFSLMLLSVIGMDRTRISVQGWRYSHTIGMLAGFILSCTTQGLFCHLYGFRIIQLLFQQPNNTHDAVTTDVLKITPTSRVISVNEEVYVSQLILTVTFLLLHTKNAFQVHPGKYNLVSFVNAKPKTGWRWVWCCLMATLCASE